jgi:cytochrome P450
MAPEIDRLARDLIARFPDAPVDLLDAFCRPIPVIVIARLLGVPEAMAPDLLRWSNAMVRMHQAGRTATDEDMAVSATKEFVAFLRGYVERRRSDPRDDLISALIAAEEAGEKLSTDELITICILLLNAGHEATVHTMGNGVRLALTLGARPGLDPEAFVEEILRFDPPLHLFTRWAYEDVTLFGHRFARGEQVGLLLASAGRDSAAYPDPDRFMPGRAGPANLAFGAGLHFCVGAPLARLELQIALAALFELCPELRLAETPRFASIYHFHGLERLTVRR